MSFLHPLALLGLAAAAIPALLHLLQRRTPPEVEFPPVRYLSDAERRSARRLRLRHLLLLLLRTALLVAVVLAAARPLVPARGGGGLHAPTALVVVLDNSLSAGAVVDGRPVLDRLKVAARAVLGRLALADRCWLVLADGVARAGTREALLAVVDSAGTDPRRLDVVAAVARAGRLVDGEPLAAREVYVVSDLQRTALTGMAAVPRGVRVVVLGPVGAVPPNRGIAMVRATERALVITVGGTPGAPAAPVTVRLRGREVGRALAAPGATLSLPLPPSPPGWWVGESELAADELRADDRRPFVWRVAPPARVSASSDVGAFLTAALAVLKDGGRVTAASPGTADVIFGEWPGTGSGGGGGSWRASVVIPPTDPAFLGQANRALAARGVAWRFAAAGTPGPLASAVLATLAGVPVTRRYRLERADADSAGVVATVNGEPWLVRAGTVVLLGSRLDTAWTGLPARPAFVPFVDAVANRVARGEAEVANAEGAPRVAFAVRGADTLGATIYGPDPRESDLTPASPSLAGRVLGGEGGAGGGGGPRRRAGRRRLRRRCVRGNRPRRREWGVAPPRASPGRRRVGRGDADALMALDFLLDRFDDLPATRALAEGLPSSGSRLSLAGLPGSSPAVLVAALARRFAQRVFAVLTPTPADAERWLADVQTLLGERAALYPQREGLGAEEPHFEIAGERVETLEALLSGRVRVLVTTARASAERTGVPAALAAARLVLSGSGKREAGSVSLTEAVAELSDMGYARAPMVTEVAQFSVRGGILDVYGFGMAAAARIEWWDDEIVSLRSFDLDTQRSGGEIERVTILPVKTEQRGEAGAGSGTRSSLLELLPTDTLVLIDQESAVEREVERAWSDAAHHLEVARRMGEEPPAREELLLAPDAWRARLRRFAQLAPGAGDAGSRFPLAPPEAIDRDLRLLRQVVAGEPPTVILCDNEGQLERLEELLGAGHATLAIGALDGGFVLPALRVLTDHEIFRRARRLRRPRRYRSASPNAAAAAGAAALTLGGYVVHLEHGIGIYRGLQTIAVGDGTLDVAVLEYEGGDRLNVPLYRLDQLEPYRAAGGGGGGNGDAPPPRLHRLGATAWQRQRDRTRAAIRKMAGELLELYARRQLASGYAFPPDTPWQRELESAFLYEDTPDQRRAAAEVKRDLERPRPMDRLLVGDVGYGKTEVALRAAFKAVQAGKQVAVLVPTTILAEQHGRTFRERLADYPVRIEVLSRFRSAKASAAAVRQLAAGAIDIVIGTHRLLSRDVVFKDLGLLVVDEEHRFGVRHKERLKALKLSVDVLTLTATPIPRTLHLSLAGLRDLTLLETPPKDRSPVLTFIEPWDDALLEEALARELDRGGQVYFVHNRIETIATIAERVRRLGPRARVAVAHGQLPEAELDTVMSRFVRGEVDILVSTMIVESGLDVPNANTMVVDRADQLGLAQLYQLRGRVGRSHRRASCYLLVPDLVDAEAEERLRVLEHHTDLGSGYRIALRDLELRGAGNLLGAEQSGHAQAVGFDMYLRWLEEEVRVLKGERQASAGERWSPPDVTLDLPAHLPTDYVTDDEAKLNLYRRLAQAEQPCEIQAVREELRDRFGPLPDDAQRLLLVAELRALGARVGLETVLVRGDEARLTFRRDAHPRLAGLTAALDAVQFEAEVRRPHPLSLRLRRLGGEAIGPGLARALTAVLQDSHTE